MKYAPPPIRQAALVMGLMSLMAWPAEAQPGPPGRTDIELAYRAHMEAINAQTVEMMGKKEALPYLVQLHSVQAGHCDYHSGVSYSCQVIVSAESGGRVTRNRVGDILMTRTPEGWRFRLMRRPR